MFPDLYWYDAWDLYSWWQDLWDRLDRKRTSMSSWQATEVITATAMAEDVDQPKEKPRPPAGGKISFQSKPELVPILAALSSIAIHRYEREERLDDAAASMG